MPSKLTNTLKDSLGIMKAVLYRTFIERNWSKPQPMFNILEVKEGKEALFEDFLKKCLEVSLKYDTPISLGSYKTNETRTYIYVTHYASTAAFLKVATSLLFKGLSSKRAAATQATSWTYCNPTNAPQLSTLNKILMVGIEGDPSSFLNFLNQKGAQPAAIVKKIKDVRGKALGTYLILEPNSENKKRIEEFIKQGGSIRVYDAAKLP